MTTTPDTNAQIRRLASRTHVHAADLYADGIEFCGSSNDQDDSAGFVAGNFDFDELVLLVPMLTVTDCRK